MSENRSSVRLTVLVFALITISAISAAAGTGWGDNIFTSVQAFFVTPTAPSSANEAVMTIAALGSFKDAGASTPTTSNGKIVFFRGFDASATIYVVDPAVPGSETAIGPGMYPAWKPDGSAILFTDTTSHEGSNTNSGELKLMNPDGSNVRSFPTVAFTANFVNNSGWSPDGTKIVYMHASPGGSFSTDIWTMNADGSGQTRLTNSSHGDMHPSWSPDGTKIAYTKSFANGDQIYTVTTVSPTESNLTNLINTNNRNPHWSPDGTTLLIESDRDHGFFGRPEIYAISPLSGAVLQRVTNDNYDDHDPIYSPDGALIVFQSGSRPETSNNKLFVMPSNGNPVSPAQQIFITTGSSSDSGQSWGPGTATPTPTPTPTPIPGVDLGLTITGPANSVPTNQEFRYQLTARNYGSVPATNVRFVDRLPAGLAFVRNQFGTCSVTGIVNTGQTVTCTIDFALPSATYANVLLYVKSSQGLTFNNQATVSSSQPEPVPDTHSNSATATTNVQTAADLSVTMDAPSQTSNGAEILYKINVKNVTTDADARSVTLTDTLPTGVTNVSMTGPTTNTVRCDPFANGRIVCHLDAVERNFTYQFLLKLTPPRTGQIINKASVSSDTNPDPNLLNNDATQITTARTVSDIAVTMTGPTQVPQGQDATYLMTVKNIGTATAQDVKFADGWSDNASLVSFSPSPGTSIPNCVQSMDGNTPVNSIGCNMGQLGPGSQLTVRVTLRPQASGNIMNQGLAFSYSTNDDVGDADDTNNVATRNTLACAAGSGSAPVFQKTGSGVASVNQPYRYQANATDSRGARITYTLAQSPTGMTIDARSGQVNWTPTNAFINQIVQVSIVASNGTCNGTATQTFSLAVGDTPPGGYLLQHGSLQITSMSSVRVTSGPTHAVKFNPKAKKPQILIEDGTYKLGGDTKINEFLSVEGDITIVVDKVHDRIDFDINGGKGYLTNIPLIGTKILWEGGRTRFTLNGQGVLSGINQTGQFLQKLEAAKVGIGLTNAQLLFAERGLRIQGNVTLPPVPGIPGLTGTVQGLEISRQNGLRFQGQITLPTFNLGGFSITGVRLDFQPDPGGNKDKDVFIGNGSLVVPNTVTVVGKVKIVGGAVDSVLASVSLQSGGVPLIPPILTLIGGTVSVEGLRTGQFSIFIGGDFTITDARLANVIKLTHAGVRYTAPGSLSGSSDLELLTFKVAQAGLGFFNLPNKKEFSFDTNVTLIDSLPVLLVGASVKTGASITDSGAQFYFQGNAFGRLQIPNGRGFGYDLIRTFVGPLPRVVTELNVLVGFPPAQFSTAVRFPIVGDFHVAVRNVQVAAQNEVQVLVGRNLNALQNAASGSTPPAVTNAAYQKKMINQMRPEAEKIKDPLAQYSLYMPVMTPNEPQAIGTVTVPADQPKAFFRLLGGQTSPRYDLIAPNGTRITPDNAPLNNAAFAQDSDSNQSFYIVTSPTAGIWTVEAEDGADGPFILDSASTNTPPVLTDVQIAPQQNGAFQITYNATDVDSPDARVSLFYAEDATSTKGTIIKGGLTPGTSGNFTWTASDGSVPSGDYNVYAVIDDDVNMPVQRYAVARVHVVDSLAPVAPQNISAIPGGANDIVVSWAPNSEPNVRGYQVRYVIDRGDGAPLTQTVDAGNVTTIRLMKLANLTNYRVAVVAYTSRDVPDPSNPGQTIAESRPSELSTIISVTSGIGIPPVVQITSPNGGESLPADGDATISWQVDRTADLLNQLVELSTDDGATYYPLQINLDGTVRNVRWHVPSGVQATSARVRVTTTDRAGNAGSDTSDAGFAFTPATGTPLQVDGRVVGSDGRGLRNAIVSITDSAGVVNTATTSSFGFFSFPNVPAGGTYTFRVLSRLYRFQSRTIQINDSATLADFVGLE